MRWVVVVALLLGCPGLPTRKEQVRQEMAAADKARDAALERLIARVRAGDERAIRRQFGDAVNYGGLWFTDADCRRELAVAGRLVGPAVTTLARCLATLPLARGDRQHSYRDVGVLTYEPGIEVEVLFGRDDDDDIVVRYIGYAGRSGIRDALPTVSQAALERLRVDPAPVVLSDAIRAEISAELAARPQLPEPEIVEVWFKLCIDSQGQVTSARPRMTTSLVAQEELAAVLSTWRFQPFVLGGQPFPVCALVRAGDPLPAGRDQKLPGTVADESEPRVIVRVHALGKRLSGGNPFPGMQEMQQTRMAGNPRSRPTY